MRLTMSPFGSGVKYAEGYAGHERRFMDRGLVHSARPIPEEPMAVQKDGPAPYAPTAAITEVIEGFRDRSPQVPFTLDTLTRLGVSESLAPRTLQALKLLDLLDDNGEPTPTFMALKQAPQDEFQARMADMVRAAYAEVFAYRDPTTDSPERVTDAFRIFTPPSTRDRMVRLFYGLCQYAGIVEETPKIEGKPTSARPRPPRAQRPAPANSETPPPPETPPTPPGGQERAPTETPTGLHPALTGLLALIPPGNQPWSQDRRDGFVKAWEATLDICHPIEGDAQTQTQ